MSSREFTGRHALALFVGCFTVIIAVNLTLAYQAIATFPGLETQNSYVASQTFDADRAAQDGLGWTVEAGVGENVLRVGVTDASGAVVRPASISATLGRATHVAEDRTPVFKWDGTAFTAPADVRAGYWTLWLELTAADGTAFHRRIPLIVAPEAADAS